jgi:hypothetical protein
MVQAPAMCETTEDIYLIIVYLMVNFPYAKLIKNHVLTTTGRVEV